MSKPHRVEPRRVEIVAGVLGARTISSTDLTGTPLRDASTGLDVEVVVSFVDRIARYVPVSVTYSVPAEPGHGPGPDEVTTSLVRSLTTARTRSIASITAEILAWPGTLAEPPDRPHEARVWGLRMPDDADLSDRDLVLRWVGHFHALGTATRGAAREVAAGLGVSRATAGRWIKEARAAGYVLSREVGVSGSS